MAMNYRARGERNTNEYIKHEEITRVQMSYINEKQ